MNFQESKQYLFNLGNEILTMKLGLENIEKILAALGNPEKKSFKVQIAGTNGKGSTCAFLNSICVSARIKTGLYTSPHIVSITERIKINGEEISEKVFAKHATKVRKTAENLVAEKKLENLPTFFEQITAIALSAFDEAKIDLAILETGLGGRFDATTAANAELAALTPIDFDHQEYLGNTLAKIAGEKAAIIHRNSKVVISEQLPEAMKVISEVCAEFNIKPITTNFQSKVTGFDEQGKFIVNFKTAKAEHRNVKINLRGRHQIENAKTAILLAEILSENHFQIEPENIVEGLQSAVHIGRLEFYKGILFDGAHNVAGAQALKNYLDEYVKKPITMIFAAMKDKNLTEIGKILFPKAEKLIFTEPDNSRSVKTKEFIKFLPENFDEKKIFLSPSVSEALEIAAKISQNNLICVTGSLYLIGEARKILNSES